MFHLRSVLNYLYLLIDNWQIYFMHIPKIAIIYLPLLLMILDDEKRNVSLWNFYMTFVDDICHRSLHYLFVHDNDFLYFGIFWGIKWFRFAFFMRKFFLYLILTFFSGIWTYYNLGVMLTRKLNAFCGVFCCYQVVLRLNFF